MARNVHPLRHHRGEALTPPGVRLERTSRDSYRVWVEHPEAQTGRVHAGTVRRHPDGYWSVVSGSEFLTSKAGDRYFRTRRDALWGTLLSLRAAAEG